MKSGPVFTRQESARTSIYFLLLHYSTFLSFKGRKKPKLGVWVSDMPVNQLLSKAEMKLPVHSPHRHRSPGTAPDSPTTGLQGAPRYPLHRDHCGGTIAGNHQTENAGEKKKKDTQQNKPSPMSPALITSHHTLFNSS